MRILFAAQDPGSANVLVPLMKKAVKEKDEVKIFAAIYAPKIFQAHKLPYIDCKVEDVGKELAAFSPDIVVTGTSMGENIEKKLTLAARKKGIKTVSVIDYWTNYSARFSDTNDPENLAYLSDIVCVIDEQMKSGCVKEGVPSERLRITGSPYLEEALEKINPDAKARNQILFISQPFSTISHPFPFDEFRAVEDLLHYKNLEKFEKIIIKLHPKEDENKYEDFLPSEQSRIPILVKKDADLYRLINESRIIVGMNSVVLLEASLAGKTVISYQPSLKQADDPLPGNAMGLSKGIYDKDSLYAYLDTLDEKNTRKPHARAERFCANATQNIYSLLNELTYGS